jgi:hypothetical protein
MFVSRTTGPAVTHSRFLQSQIAAGHQLRRRPGVAACEQRHIVALTHQLLVSQETIRTVPPYSLGGTHSCNGAI